MCESYNSWKILGILLHSIVFYCIQLYLLHSIALYCILLHSIVFYCILLHSIPQKAYNCPTFTSFTRFIFLKCTYIVSYVGVTVLLQAVPDDDDNTRGSKHVGLTYNNCDSRYQNKITRVHFLVWYFLLNKEFSLTDSTKFDARV
jgi:hypothetical protein